METNALVAFETTITQFKKNRCYKINRSSFVQCVLCCPSPVPRCGAGLVSVVERLSALAERLRAVPLGLELLHLVEELRCLRCPGKMWQLDENLGQLIFDPCHMSKEVVNTTKNPKGGDFHFMFQQCSMYHSRSAKETAEMHPTPIVVQRFFRATQRPSLLSFFAP